MSALAIFYALLFYAATLMLVGGLAVKIRSYAKTPAPLLIPTTPAPIDATGVVLRMTREEIGTYPGLKLETVSRCFSRFHEDGILAVRQRHIQVLDPDALQNIVGSVQA